MAPRDELVFETPTETIVHPFYTSFLGQTELNSAKEPFANNSSNPISILGSTPSPIPSSGPNTVSDPPEATSEGTGWDYDKDLSYSVKVGEDKKTVKGKITGLDAVRLKGSYKGTVKPRLNPSLQAYYDNPPPSAEQDTLFWTAVCNLFGITYDEEYRRFFNAWAAQENTMATWNPLATSWPGVGNYAKDPDMTAFNWAKSANNHWVKNYSKLDYGAYATYRTITYPEYRYKNIVDGLKNKKFKDKNWWLSSEVKAEFKTYGGHGGTYNEKVYSHYEKSRSRKTNIITNRPSGLAGRAVKR
jgi:hypothetical protein